MKASIPYEFSDQDRRAIARFLGQDEKATHIQCVAWAREQLRVTLGLMADAKPLAARLAMTVGGGVLE